MGARGLATMAQDKRILVAGAADILGKPRGKRLINQAWKQGFITLRGVRPGESEPVEIPSNEGGRVDCKKSLIVIGRLATTHHSVTMAWADVERLARADVDWLLREAASPAPKDEGNPAAAQEAGGNQATLPLIVGTGKAATIARWLRHIYPTGRTGKSLDEMETDVRDTASKDPAKDLAGSRGRRSNALFDWRGRRLKRASAR
jgi:hypothetical protein